MPEISETVGIDIIHQKATDTLPPQVEAEVVEHLGQLAQEIGITLENTFEVAPGGETPDNKIMLQAFEWYLPADSGHWDRLRVAAQDLKALGVGGVWLPPCCKALHHGDVGYGLYDLWDLGEFDQKGSVPTKYGTLEALRAVIDALHGQGMQVYADAVLNHKAGADEVQLFEAVRVNPDNRNEDLSAPYDIKGWTRFTFPGRGGKYSGFQWSFEHFTAVDYDDLHQEGGIFRIIGDNKGFAPAVDSEKGNFDYLMFADIDYRHQDVIAEVLRWGDWFVNTLNLDGMRLDAIKHINASFLDVFLSAVRLRTGKNLYMFGEYWHRHDEVLAGLIDKLGNKLALFDVALHFNFHEAALRGREYDLRRIFDDTLLQHNPLNAVTFVDNHDSQEGQALQSWVGGPFKLLAYALIMLRRDGYPCLFYGDYYGIGGGPNPFPPLREHLDPVLLARREAAYGEQVDYFDHGNCVGWVRLGDEAHPSSGLACVMSNGDDGYKRMSLGELNKGTVWQDITGRIKDRVTLDERGEGQFHCLGQSVSVYVRE